MGIWVAAQGPHKMKKVFYTVYKQIILCTEINLINSKASETSFYKRTDIIKHYWIGFKLPLQMPPLPPFKWGPLAQAYWAYSF